MNPRHPFRLLARLAAVACVAAGLAGCGQPSVESTAVEELRHGAQMIGYPLQLKVDVSARSRAGASKVLSSLHSNGFPATYDVTVSNNPPASQWMVHTSSGLLRDEQELEATFRLLMSIERSEVSGIAWRVSKAQPNAQPRA